MQDENPPFIEEPPPLPPEENWFDRQAASYAPWMVWVHLLICACPGLVVGLLFLAGCNTREGKALGVRLLKFSGIGFAIFLLVQYLASKAQ
jgi:hypothetical protein